MTAEDAVQGFSWSHQHLEIAAQCTGVSMYLSGEHADLEVVARCTGVSTCLNAEHASELHVVLLCIFWTTLRSRTQET